MNTYITVVFPTTCVYKYSVIFRTTHTHIVKIAFWLKKKGRILGILFHFKGKEKTSVAKSCLIVFFSLSLRPFVLSFLSWIFDSECFGFFWPLMKQNNHFFEQKSQGSRGFLIKRGGGDWGVRVSMEEKGIRKYIF